MIAQFNDGTVTGTDRGIALPASIGDTSIFFYDDPSSLGSPTSFSIPVSCIPASGECAAPFVTFGSASANPLELANGAGNTFTFGDYVFTTGADPWQVQDNGGTARIVVIAGTASSSNGIGSATLRITWFNTTAAQAPFVGVVISDEIPEPATFIFAGTGLLALGLMARRRKQS